MAAGVSPPGKGQVEGLWAGRTVGLDGVRSEIAMMGTPDGHGKLELTRYHPSAAAAAGPADRPRQAIAAGLLLSVVTLRWSGGVACYGPARCRLSRRAAARRQ